mmetsp:Transcript_17702/g.40138  ORF Transcript_17702/g.40138 Transcript_17702/m.40138 type:complete len:96 (-) Transcript_17702:79-366(-)
MKEIPPALRGLLRREGGGRTGLWPGAARRLTRRREKKATRAYGERGCGALERKITKVTAALVVFNLRSSIERMEVRTRLKKANSFFQDIFASSYL